MAEFLGSRYVFMNIQVTNQAVKDVSGDVLIVAAAQKARQKGKGAILSDAARSVDKLLGGLIDELCTSGEFKGNLGELTTIYTMGKLTAKRILLVGLGSQETLNSQVLRRASAIAARHAQHTGAHQLV